MLKIFSSFLPLNLTNLLIISTAKNVCYSLTFMIDIGRDFYQHSEGLGLLNSTQNFHSTTQFSVPISAQILFAQCNYWRKLISFIFVLFPRQIPETEGASLAASHSVGFTEISVAENSPNLYKVFEKLLIESRGRPVKPRKFSVSKMIGNLKRKFFKYDR